MGVLSNLEPKRVFYYFEEITRIPHGSGNVEMISNFLVDFAKEHSLKYIQDEMKNVIIFKNAMPGYEDEPTVILQGHMDMVAVSKPGYDIDMKTEGLRVAVDGDNIYAEGTSLGGDDGIALAYALALLESDTIKHPALEVIITVDEEVGMDGAMAIDLSMLKGSRMINLDSEEEGYFLTSCAGGGRVECNLDVELEEVELLCGSKTEEAIDESNCSDEQFVGYELRVAGLLGGHSGAEIHKERGNSNCIFGRVLYELATEINVRLVSVKGGLADNAIPRETMGNIIIPKANVQKLIGIIDRCREEISAELATKDPGFKLELREVSGGKSVGACTAGETLNMARFLVSLPNGVQAMSADMEGLVETSLNLGVLSMNGTDNTARLSAAFAVRSSVESAKTALVDRLIAVTELAGGKCTVSGMYPGWKYRVDSPLRDKMIRIYEKLYGKAPKVDAIHAGLECGILGGKIDDLDCVSIGPDMMNIHTTEETLSISSTGRVWEYLVALLEEK